MRIHTSLVEQRVVINLDKHKVVRMEMVMVTHKVEMETEMVVMVMVEMLVVEMVEVTEDEVI
jgi:hypothetical protein